MRNIIFTILILLPISSVAQFTPPPAGAYSLDTGSWAPITGTGSVGLLPYQPPPVALYCQNGSGQWIAWTVAACGGGGGGLTYPSDTGIVRVAAGAAWGTTAELSGDATTSGSNAVTVVKINGIAVTGTPSVGYVPTATSSSAATWQAAGGSIPPLTFIQESQVVFGAGTSFTVTFPRALQGSGATAFMLISGDLSSFGAPSGWTTDFTQAANLSGLILVHVASAGQTTAVFTGASSSPSVYFFEVSGSHTLDVKSTVSTGSTNYSSTLIPPAITPTAGAAVFSVAAVILINPSAANTWGKLLVHNLAPGWNPIDNYVQITNGGRGLAGYMSTVPATAVSTFGPTITLTNANPWFASSGVAYGTFSIK